MTAPALALIVGVNVLASTVGTLIGRAVVRTARLAEPNPLLVALATAGTFVAVGAIAKHLEDGDSP